MANFSAAERAILAFFTVGKTVDFQGRPIQSKLLASQLVHKVKPKLMYTFYCKTTVKLTKSKFHTKRAMLIF
ncbi:hypothetical protein [Moraxella cuniculi]|uniref:hypothetical protein n=1 Tax=Moraxella cuniculi TaxID=34061 RepID=UPI0018D4F0D5|nr:hypothetical protein [Moraxella cuniculi]